MAKETPGLPSDDRHRMWLTLDEMLSWQPQRDVAKPYPAAALPQAERE
jgi:NADH-quinone oxidoreductase subunit I